MSTERRYAWVLPMLSLTWAKVLIVGVVLEKGKEGICITKTKQAILIAHYPETVQPGSAANTVEQLGDYLISVGY